MSRGDREPAGMERLGPRTGAARRATAAIGVAVVCAVMVSCTSVGPPTGDGRVATRVVEPSSPAPSLTPLDVVRCTVTRELPANRDPLPARLVWPSGRPGLQAQTFVTYPDAGPDRCPGTLPRSGCLALAPWRAPLGEDFVVASRAKRLIDGSSEAIVSTAASAVPTRQSVRYGVVELPAGDPRRAVPYLERVMRECADAVPQRVGGASRLVGSTTSYYRQGPATVVLLTAKDAAAWLVLDGTTVVDAAELARIVGTAASRLLPS